MELELVRVLYVTAMKFVKVDVRWNIVIKPLKALHSRLKVIYLPDIDR